MQGLLFGIIVLKLMVSKSVYCIYLLSVCLNVVMYVCLVFKNIWMNVHDICYSNSGNFSSRSACYELYDTNTF